jgi:hypothetical protein
MYPSQYFNLFPPFPRENKVFVAMSFHPIFNKRWESVIAPAIKRVERNNVPLEPYRVDIRRVSDSILTEILTGISNSLVIFADVSSVGKIEDKPIRNGNVMYEVGLAHATRLPEEVILFRSDNDELLFDVANVRINFYDPDDDPETAVRLVGTAIIEAIKEVDLKRNLAVKAAAESLDYACWDILFHAAAINEIDPPSIRTMGQALGNQSRISGISRLLEIGALKTKYRQITPELISELKDQPVEKLLKYQLTNFGIVLINYIVSKMGINMSPGLREKIEKLVDDTADTTKTK